MAKLPPSSSRNLSRSRSPTTRVKEGRDALRGASGPQASFRSRGPLVAGIWRIQASWTRRLLSPATRASNPTVAWTTLAQQARFRTARWAAAISNSSVEACTPMTRPVPAKCPITCPVEVTLPTVTRKMVTLCSGFKASSTLGIPFITP